MVRINVTLDVFSGNVNPSWEMPEDKVKEFFEMKDWKELMIPQDNEANLGLGYRGFVLSVLSGEVEKRNSTTTESLVQRKPSNLPDTFRIYGTKKITPESIDIRPSLDLKEIQDKEKWLLNTSRGNIMSLDTNTNTKSKVDLSPELIQYVEKSISKNTMTSDNVPEIQESNDSSEKLTASLELITQTYNPSFWNNPNFVTRNNCYNYAANLRTNTFAQPGYANGCYPFSNNCASVVNSAHCDGMRPNDLGNSYLVALVINPGIDYHFYTWHAEGFWAHKPGRTPARNWDDSGTIIANPLNPANCDRGDYTQFCGYHYISGNAIIGGFQT